MGRDDARVNIVDLVDLVDSGVLTRQAGGLTEPTHSAAVAARERAGKGGERAENW